MTSSAGAVVAEYEAVCVVPVVMVELDEQVSAVGCRCSERRLSVARKSPVSALCWARSDSMAALARLVVSDCI